MVAVPGKSRVKLQGSVYYVVKYLSIKKRPAYDQVKNFVRLEVRFPAIQASSDVRTKTRKGPFLAPSIVWLGKNYRLEIILQAELHDARQR